MTLKIKLVFKINKLEKIINVNHKVVDRQTMSVRRAGRSAGFFLRQRSTKSLNSTEKTPEGSFGGGSLTI